MITKKELEILRDLAKRQKEIATSEQMVQLKKDWKAHGAFQGKRPMVLIETGTFGNDLLSPRLTCENEEARKLEFMFLKNLVNHVEFKDDTIVNDYIGATWHSYFNPWGIEVQVDRVSGELGHHFISQIVDLEDDFHKFKKSVFGVNKESSLHNFEYLNEMFGDILPVKFTGGSLYATPTQCLVHIMSMEDMFVAMCDYPDKFLEIMDRLANDYVEYFAYLEQGDFLLPTTEQEWLGQGSYCFTNELPNKEGHVTRKDVWGYIDSQETVGISKEMFQELVFPSYKKIADEYGLLSYGCCEPVDFIWENCLSKLENLRKVSISPWCNEEIMGEQLKGKKIVYLRKPSPNYLGVGQNLDEEGVKEHIKRTLLAAKGCTIEFAQRDVYKVNADSGKVARFVELIKQHDKNAYLKRFLLKSRPHPDCHQKPEGNTKQSSSCINCNTFY